MWFKGGLPSLYGIITLGWAWYFKNPDPQYAHQWTLFTKRGGVEFGINEQKCD